MAVKLYYFPYSSFIMTIARLIEGCKKQDRSCQKTLYLQYVQLASRISLRYARDEHEAKDIVQNAFVKVFTKIKSYKARKGTFESWLSRIVINEALQLYRKQQKYATWEADFSEELEASPDALDKLQAEDILKLLRKLPDGYRLVFVLFVVEGYTHQEIAKELGINTSTSRSQLTRAKKLLQKFITEQNSLEHAKDFTK
ncbi:MAG: sigma-70 family RNA polymerase sigma factor [Bacteroidota bacterium]